MTGLRGARGEREAFAGVCSRPTALARALGFHLDLPDALRPPDQVEVNPGGGGTWNNVSVLPEMREDGPPGPACAPAALTPNGKQDDPRWGRAGPSSPDPKTQRNHRLRRSRPRRRGLSLLNR